MLTVIKTYAPALAHVPHRFLRVTCVGAVNIGLKPFLLIREQYPGLLHLVNEIEIDQIGARCCFICFDPIVYDICPMQLLNQQVPTPT